MILGNIQPDFSIYFACVVDPDPVGSEAFWTGRFRIRNNLCGSGSETGSDLFTIKMCTTIYAFFHNSKVVELAVD
jgi:hypothetical protein